MLMSMLSPADVKAARPLLTLAVVVSGVLSALMIVAGVIAIVVQARSATTNFIWWGINISTGDVGVALVALGAVSSVLVIRKLFQVIAELAKIPRK